MPVRMLVSWAEDSARVEIEIDGQNRVVFVRRIGPHPATATVCRPDGTRAVTLGRTQTEVSVPTGVAQRIQLTWDAARGRYDGLSGEVLTE